MIEPTLGKQVEFLKEIEKLKAIKSANKSVDGGQENSAEHSRHVALMSVILFSYADGEIGSYKRYMLSK